MLMPNMQSDQYGFQAEPRAVRPRGKYRDVPNINQDDDEEKKGNIMWDKRVVRGNTYSAMMSSAHSGDT